MLICDRCGGHATEVRHLAIGECEPETVHRHQRKVSPFESMLPMAFEGDLCSTCRDYVWDGIREMTKELANAHPT